MRDLVVDGVVVAVRVVEMVGVLVLVVDAAAVCVAVGVGGAPTLVLADGGAYDVLTVLELDVEMLPLRECVGVRDGDVDAVTDMVTVTLEVALVEVEGLKERDGVRVAEVS